MLSPTQARRAHRCSYDPAEVEKHGILLCTLFYRAPEMLFGNVSFDAKVDIWSLGLVAVEASGHPFMKKLTGVSYSQTGYMAALFGQLGTPTCEEITRLPRWPHKPPAFKTKPWPAKVRTVMGGALLDMIGNQMLAWAPARRPTAAEVRGRGDDRLFARLIRA